MQSKTCNLKCVSDWLVRFPAEQVSIKVVFTSTESFTVCKFLWKIFQARGAVTVN